MDNEQKRINGKGAPEETQFSNPTVERQLISCPFCAAQKKPMSFVNNQDLDSHISAWHKNQDILPKRDKNDYADQHDY